LSLNPKPQPKPWERPPLSWIALFALLMLALNLLGVAFVLSYLGY
jgi:hypothetical protein